MGLFWRVSWNSPDYSGLYAAMVLMKRMITPYICKDLDKKIVLITGPRQTGKTYISKRLKSSKN
ncbi:MAG: hypothetical protein HRT90_08750 [Candidatus Margulisbacteria bacterium]|nr:hypothetical protein [Candidatus Margulisiibacteriota bacterium]